MNETIRRVVLVDDSEIILESISNALEDIGCEVVAVTEPSRSAFALEGDPDLVLLDVNMPQAFGDDIARFLRQSWGLRSPIFLYSSLSEEELDARAQQAGADGFICKSWGMERLVERVREILGIEELPGGELEELEGALEEGEAEGRSGGFEREVRQTVQHRFVRRCIERKERIGDLLEAHERGTFDDVAHTLRTIAVQLHDFVGEAKLLGLDRVAAYASSVKEIVEQQGGAILKGAQLRTFRACLEQLTETAERAAIESPRDSSLLDTLEALRAPVKQEDDGAGGEGEREDDEAFNEPRRILIVDDSPIVGEVLSLELEARGHEVALATCLSEFNRRMTEFDPELIFLDVEMPEINGAELCRHLRQHPKTRKLPIIFLSSLPEEELDELAQNSGANGYLSKQRGMDDLIKYLDDLLLEIIF